MAVMEHLFLHGGIIKFCMNFDSLVINAIEGLLFGACMSFIHMDIDW